MGNPPLGNEGRPVPGSDVLLDPGKEEVPVPLTGVEEGLEPVPLGPVLIGPEGLVLPLVSLEYEAETVLLTVDDPVGKTVVT